MNLRFSHLAPLGCWGILTQEVKALHDSYGEINRNIPSKTPKGRKIGKTKAEFFKSEQAALDPFIPGLFDNLIDS